MQRPGQLRRGDARLTDLMLTVRPRMARRVSAALRDDGHPSPERLRALYGLRDGPLRVTDLADAWRISVPSVSRLLDALADDGFVARSGDADDRRVVRVELTPQGAMTLAAAEMAAQRVVLDLLRSLSPEQRRRLAAALADLEAVLDADGMSAARAARA
jgi:DNA-binding MarR family transcriptional regulator